MSGLEKWQMDNPEWREKLLKHLLVERPLAVLKPTTPEETDRYSLSVIDDFKELHDARKAQDTNKMNRQLEPVSDQLMTGNCDLTMIDEARCDDQNLNNESFEALEKMCNKTVSDPDSTIFHYMHSDHKEEILENAKKRSGDNFSLQKLKESNPNNFALHRLIQNLKMEESEQLENESPLKGIDCTQIEDIEAPSRLWESTFCNPESMKTSPVKMVGLLRPSTILESCEDSVLSSEDTSQLSFKSAAKGEEHTSDSALTSCYETANDQTASTNNDPYTANVEKLFYAAVEKIRSADSLNKDEIIAVTNDENKSFNLINLEETFAASPEDSESYVIELSSSSDDEIKESNNLNVTKQVKSIVKEEKLSVLSAKSIDRNVFDLSQLVDEADSSEETDKENKEASEASLHFNDTMEEVEYMMRKGLEYMAANSNNAPKNTPVTTIPAQTRVKNAEYKISLEAMSPLIKQRTFVISPKKTNGSATNTPTQRHLMANTASNIQFFSEKQNGAIPKRPIGAQSVKKFMDSPQRSFKYASATATKSNAASPRPPFSSTFAKTKTVASPKQPIALKKTTTSNSPSNYFIEMNRQPQREFFKQPSAIPSQIQKEIKQPYSHIVSPIRTYMQKTAMTPLISSMNPKSSKADLLNASVFREADQKSQTYQPNFNSVGGINPNAKVGISGIPQGKSLLPCKAYVSSNIKHVVDGRTPVTIPGGQKIHKFLESAMVPTVLRHDGKAKIPGGINQQTDEVHSSATSNLPRPREQKSLANLSVMSGDISLYTMKDAQKF